MVPLAQAKIVSGANGGAEFPIALGTSGSN